MNRNFKVAEILKSVDSIVSDNNYIAYDKKTIFNRYTRFTNQKINMSNLPETEKIIIQAEKSLKNPNEVLVLKNEYVEKLVLKNEYVEKLVLKDALVEDHLKEENDSNETSEEISIQEENNLKDLENNFVYMNEKLKSLTTKQDEKIKDLNILLDKFISQERYKDLDKKIKLYQDDNSTLRQKILSLSDVESKLRLQMAGLSLNNKTEEEKIKQSTQTESEVIKKLNIIIEELLQKNTQSTDIDQKIKFYREENAKIIVDKSEIERKLENTKSQLAMNENNKKEIKIALNNLNKILAASNIESSTFINKLEEQTLNTNPVVDENTTKKL